LRAQVKFSCTLARGGARNEAQEKDMTQRDKSPRPTESVPRTLPPEAWQPIFGVARLTKRRLDSFFRGEAASGIVLLVAAGLALVWANSPWAKSYTVLWHTPLGFHVGSLAFESSLEWFVNDVLMAIFFFVVGLEIRKELYDGELSEWRRAALPAVAAVGGMLAPALVYLSLVGERRAHSGWGVPMATDIAFALGVLALLGKRVPPALRVLLLALAVIDDLGAILIIAFFYSPGIQVSGLLIAAGGVALILALRAMGVRAFWAYVLAAVVVWVGVHSSGIHPTIAGVIVGLLTPVRNGVAIAGRNAVSPAEVLIEALHPWIAFLIMPVFALANAGVSLHGIAFSGATAKVSVAIVAALVLGKPLGIIAVSLLAIRSRLSVLPEGLNVRHLAVLGTVAGVGFTMSLFIAQLAFADASLLGAAKLGVLAASALAMIGGLLIGRAALPLADEEQGPAGRDNGELAS
jgi:NhaA family Na+:H+ antiporter